MIYPFLIQTHILTLYTLGPFISGCVALLMPVFVCGALLTNVLQITRYPRFLREIARLLRPGGLALLIEPTLDPCASSDPPMAGWHDFWETYRACLRQRGIDTTIPERLP